MALESGNFIHDLVSTNPLASDNLAKADDHLRLIKRALYGTGPAGSTGSFRKFTGPIELTSDELNALPADIAAVQADLDAEVAEIVEHVVPKGAILMWGGAIPGTIPAGWELCDGNLDANGDPKPDLRDRFIIGAGTTYTVGATGGQLGGTTGPGGSHSHGGTTGDHALTIAELPDLSSALEIRFDANSQSDSHTQTDRVARGRNDGGTWHANPIRTQGLNGEPHSHTISTEGDHTHPNPLPAYYALAYIIKVSEYVDPSTP